MGIFNKHKAARPGAAIQTAPRENPGDKVQELTEVTAEDLAGDSAPSCEWERYLEATEALDCGTSVGLDPKVILQELGLSLSDYIHAGTYWGNWFTQNALRDPSILARHIELSDKYRAKYAVIESGQDVAAQA